MEIQASTFKELYSVVHCAGEKKLKEVQLCLEGMVLSYIKSRDIHVVIIL